MEDQQDPNSIPETEQLEADPLYMEEAKEVPKPNEVIQHTAAFMQWVLSQNTSMTNAVVIMFNDEGSIVQGTAIVPTTKQVIAGSLILGVIEQFKLKMHVDMNREAFQKLFFDFINKP